MDLTVISAEIQQVFVFVYAALIFWALVFMVAASILLAFIDLINRYRQRPNKSNERR